MPTDGIFLFEPPLIRLFATIKPKEDLQIRSHGNKTELIVIKMQQHFLKKLDVAAYKSW